MAKKNVLSPVALEILGVLKNSKEPMTFADVKVLVPSANPSHLGALKTRGLVNSAETEITETVKRKVKRNVYSLVEKTEKTSE